jgi:hypothetical protein
MLQQLSQRRPDLVTTRHLVQQFMRIVRERRGRNLEAWGRRVQADDLRNFAASAATCTATRRLSGLGRRKFALREREQHCCTAKLYCVSQAMIAEHGDSITHTPLCH